MANVVAREKDAYIPFKRRCDVRESNLIRFAEIKNPIPDEIADGKDLQKLFDRFPYIPYSTSDRQTAHYLLWHLINSKYTSETKGAIIESVNSFSFGGQYKYVRAYDKRVYNPFKNDKGLSQEEWMSYNEFLGSIDLCGKNYHSLACELSEHKQLTGMQGVEVIYTQSFGQPMVTFACVRPDKYMHKYNGPDGMREVAISDKWSTSYLAKYEPREVPLWPEYREYSDGTIRTFVYEKDGSAKYNGRASDFASFPNQYNEYKINEFILKQVDGNFMAQTLIELESTQPGISPFGNEAEESIPRKLERHFTSRGRRPKRVMAVTRPKKGGKAFVHDFKPYTSEDYYTTLLDRFEKSIHKANHWPLALMLDHSSGFNSQMFKDIFEIVSATKVLKHQLSSGGVINTCLMIASEWLLKDEHKEKSIDYMSPIQQLINQKVEALEGEDIMDIDEADLN